MRLRSAMAGLFAALALTACDCGGAVTGKPCECAMPAHGFQRCPGGTCAACQCLGKAPARAIDPGAKELFVDPDVQVTGGDGTAARPWKRVDWPAVDVALATGPVIVFFSARLAATDGNQTSTDPLDVLRTDDGTNHLTLDGKSRFNSNDMSPSWQTHAGSSRAQYPGASTTTEKVKRSHVTLTGFELADSKSQGVYWEAGDDVVLDDLVIHGNGVSAAILFNYANRSGLPSSGITVRSCHLYDVTGECIYIGGVENMGGPSHSNVLIENNLIRECGRRKRNGDDWDGINIKDQIDGVVLRHNVITEALRGVQVTSSDLIIEHNLVFDTHASSIVLGGGWSKGIGATTRVTDNVLLRGVEAGIYVDADVDAVTGPLLENNTVVAITGNPGAGFHFAANAGLVATTRNNIVAKSTSGADGWGQVDAGFTHCDFFENGTNVKRALLGSTAETCSSDDPQLGDLDQLAGPDGVFFTADDGWLPQASEVRAGAADGGPLGARL